MDYNVEDNTFPVAVADDHLTDVDYHSIRPLEVWEVGWLLSMLISLGRNTLQLDYHCSYMDSKANFVHWHIHFQDRGRIVVNP